MHVANLQLEGLLMAIAALDNLLVKKGLVTVEEIDEALHKAEAGITAEERLTEDMSPSNRDATCFPIRLLRMANLGRSETSVQPFSELARQIGQTKKLYNDQI